MERERPTDKCLLTWTEVRLNQTVFLSKYRRPDNTFYIVSRSVDGFMLETEELGKEDRQIRRS